VNGWPERGRDVSRYVRVAMRERDDGTLVGRAPVAGHVRGPGGAVRAGVVLTLLDQVGGLSAGLAALPGGWVVSTNLCARLVARAPAAGPLRIDASVLRVGRSSVVTGVAVVDEGGAGALVADGVLTSAILVPEQGPPRWERPVVLDPGPAPAEPLPPLADWIGATACGDDALEVVLDDRLRNPWGMLHGGVVAMLVDLAAEHATGGTAADVVLHFLAPNRVGPVRAYVRPVGTRPDGAVLRVEVRDEGAARVTAVAVVTAATRA
jgi:uncharacterized protein (TIGR00369 family)